jgi:DtxR family Mn-dependent transcriptional regulator
MSGLIDTTEMYLRTILELEEEGVIPLRARMAEGLWGWKVLRGG